MKQYLDICRLIEEERDLVDKVIELQNFLTGDKYDDLPQEDRSLLDIQIYTMHSYLQVLRARVRRATEAEGE